MSRKGWPILALKNTDLTLEDVFLRLTTEQGPTHRLKRSKRGGEQS